MSFITRALLHLMEASIGVRHAVMKLQLQVAILSLHKITSSTTQATARFIGSCWCIQSKNEVSMKPRYLAALILLYGAAVFAQKGAVDVKQAEQFRLDMRAAMDQNTRDLMDPLKRPDHELRLNSLVARSTKLFGDQFNPKLGSCVKAASLLQSGWADQISLLSSPSAIDVGTHTTMTFEAGIEYWNCRLAIDALTQRSKP